jgi:hypothetical protein
VLPGLGLDLLTRFIRCTHDIRRHPRFSRGAARMSALPETANQCCSLRQGTLPPVTPPDRRSDPKDQSPCRDSSPGIPAVPTTSRAH